jgi:hypothetical protein
MPFKSLAQKSYLESNVGKKPGLTPAVLAEYEQASQGMALPERAGDAANEEPSDTPSPTTQNGMNGPGGSHHGQLATHHAKLGAHYRGKGMSSLSALHKQLAEAHASHATGDHQASVKTRATAAAGKRGMGKPSHAVD